MPKKITVTVKESEKELSSLLSKSKSDRQRGRLKLLLVLKQGKLTYHKHIASKLGFTEKTIREWIKLYIKEGLNGLITIKVGGNRTSVIPKEVQIWIEQQLKNPQTTITSYVELQQQIIDVFGVTINYKTLNGYCVRVFKSKLKVSRKSHYKNDALAVEAFKKTT